MERAHQELSNGVGRFSLDQLLREKFRKNDEKIGHFQQSIVKQIVNEFNFGFSYNTPWVLNFAPVLIIFLLSLSL